MSTVQEQAIESEAGYGERGRRRGREGRSGGILAGGRRRAHQDRADQEDDGGRGYEGDD